jgi:hypothetical protein
MRSRAFPRKPRGGAEPRLAGAGTRRSAEPEMACPGPGTPAAWPAVQLSRPGAYLGSRRRSCAEHTPSPARPAPPESQFVHQYDKKEHYCGRSGFSGKKGTPLSGTRSSAEARSFTIFPVSAASQHACLPRYAYVPPHTPASPQGPGHHPGAGAERDIEAIGAAEHLSTLSKVTVPLLGPSLVVRVRQGGSHGSAHLRLAPGRRPGGARGRTASIGPQRAHAGRAAARPVHVRHRRPGRQRRDAVDRRRAARVRGVTRRPCRPVSPRWR